MKVGPQTLVEGRQKFYFIFFRPKAHQALQTHKQIEIFVRCGQQAADLFLFSQFAKHEDFEDTQ